MIGKLWYEKLTRRFKSLPIELEIPIFWTVASLLVSHFTGLANIDPLRFVVLLPYVLFVPGFVLCNVVFSKRQQALATMFIGSVLLSLMTLYPASILTVLIEGQSGQAVFQRHLPNSILALSILTLTYIALSVILKRFPRFVIPRPNPKTLIILVFAITSYSFLVFNNLGRANVFGDEYDISYQAYNLHDGILVGRKALVTSYNTHPPGIMATSHYLLQIINPNGLESLTDAQYRFPEAVVGLVTLGLVYFFTKEYFGIPVAVISVLLLSVNNYHIWFSRFVEREIFLTPFMIGYLFCLKKIVVDKGKAFFLLAGLFLGGALLVKASALILLVFTLVVISWSGFKKIFGVALVIFSPVILYNLAAYLTTGYADSFFSRIIPGAKNPFATEAVHGALSVNPGTIFFLLGDLFGWPFFILLLVAFVFALWHFLKKRNLNLGLILLWLCVSLIFYVPIVVRAYYLHFVTIPVVILISWFLKRTKLVLAVPIFLAVFFYSFFYSYNTNQATNFILDQKYDDSGRSNKPLLYPDFPTRNFSIAARSWAEDRGWDKAVDYFSAKSDNFCVIFSPELDSIALRRYFWYKDEVRRAYLGTYLPTRFPVCDQIQAENKYILSQKRTPMVIERIIFNQAGQEQFYVYKI